jgi:ABC-type transporter Mla subunit MlaD
MIGVGIFGAVVGVIGLVVGRQLVTELERSVDDSLVLTADALDSVADTVEVARSVVDTIDDGLATVGDVTAEVASSLDSTERVLGRVATATGGQLPDGIESVTDALPTLVTVAGAVDDALRLLSQAPFGPNYDPDVSFDDALRPVAETLTPVPDELRAVSSDLAALASSSATVREDVDRLADDVSAVSAELAEAKLLLDRYAETATGAQQLAARTRGDLEGQSDLARLLVTLLGLSFVAGQIVPLWIGRELLQRPILPPDEVPGDDMAPDEVDA